MNRCKKSKIFEHYRKNHRFFRKKAQVETQFNWIFILVVGAIIMVFFVAIVMKQKDASEVKISETVMTDLQSIFTGGSVSTGTSQLIEVPEVEIEFDTSTYGLKGVNNPIGEDMMMFAPSLVKGRSIITWTLDYNLPYKITSFLYITTSEMRYVFVGGGDKDRLFYNSTLPKEMNIDFVTSLGEIEDRNNYKVRLIYLTGTPDDIPQELAHMGEDLTALQISASSLKFYESNGNKFVPQYGDGETYMVDISTQQLQPTLFGAMFTDDYELYNHMMGKVLKRAYFVSKVYAERNRNISEFFDATNSHCKHFRYDPDTFDSFVDDIDDAHENFPDQSKIISLLDKAKAITSKNKILLQKSCPLIY